MVGLWIVWQKRIGAMNCNGKVRRDGVLMSNSIGWRSTDKCCNRTVAVGIEQLGNSKN